MIVGVPDHSELEQTGVGWLNLAWEITIETLKDFFVVSNELDADEDLRRFSVEYQINYWHAQRYRLNNAIALLQQSMELFLKVRIAAVSPFLLIVNEPQSWPKTNKSGEIAFADFRTLDAVHLCKVANAVSLIPLPKDFVPFYESVRKERNKILHLNAGNMRVQAETVLVNVLTAFKFLFPDADWVEFRRKYMVSTGQYTAPLDEEDYTHSSLMPEIQAAFDTLAPRHIRAFFKYNPRKKGLRCPRCMSLRTSWDDTEPTFAQMQDDGTVRCVACSTTFSAQEYQAQAEEWGVL